MGICQSKIFFSNKDYGETNRSKRKDSKLLNISIPPDTEMLLPQRVVNNSYLTYDSCISEVKFQFRVSLLNDNLKCIRKGHLMMTKIDLTFYQNDLMSVILSWPMTTLRWYAYSNNLFIFQCGRKATTGEGTFIFSCNDHQNLKESFDMLMLENSVNLNLERRQNLSDCKDNCRVTTCRFLRQNSAFDSRFLKNTNPLNSRFNFNRSQSVNEASNRLPIDKYSMLQDFATMSNIRPREVNSNPSDITSSESTLSGEANMVPNVASVAAENYLTGVGNFAPAGQYLVAVAADPLHAYINQEADLRNTDLPDVPAQYLNFPHINYSQLAHLGATDQPL